MQTLNLFRHAFGSAGRRLRMLFFPLGELGELCARLFWLPYRERGLLVPVFILCLCLGSAAPAAELSLGGSGFASPLLDTTAPDAPSAVVQPALPAVSPSAWMKGGPVQTLTLDDPEPAPAPTKVELDLPVLAADSGVPDLMVYTVLGALLLALAWACAGSLSRRQLTPLHTEIDRRSSRSQRARMLPLDVRG